MSRKFLICAIPALLIKMWIGPSCWRASATRAPTSSFLATSARRAIAFLRLDLPLISAATASARRWLMSATTTRAPSWAKSWAVALPRPEPAPVTIAILPFNRISAPFHVGAPIGAQDLSGDKPSFLGSEIRDRVRDVFRLTKPAHGNVFCDAFNPALRATPHHWRVYRS